MARTLCAHSLCCAVLFAAAPLLPLSVLRPLLQLSGPVQQEGKHSVPRIG